MATTNHWAQRSPQFEFMEALLLLWIITKSENTESNSGNKTNDDGDRNDDEDDDDGWRSVGEDADEHSCVRHS